MVRRGKFPKSCRRSHAGRCASPYNCAEPSKQNPTMPHEKSVTNRISGHRPPLIRYYYNNFSTVKCSNCGSPVEILKNNVSSMFFRLLPLFASFRLSMMHRCPTTAAAPYSWSELARPLTPSRSLIRQPPGLVRTSHSFHCLPTKKHR
jgi:hypothetical protein